MPKRQMGFKLQKNPKYTFQPPKDQGTMGDTRQDLLQMVLSPQNQ